MRSDFGSAAASVAKAVVFYVLKRSPEMFPGQHQYRREASGPRHSSYCASVENAQRFGSVSSAIECLKIGCAASGVNQIVRVEEVRIAPRREVVTSGDLSLLNKGPVVLYGTVAGMYVGYDSACDLFTWVKSVAEAKTFLNQEDATGWLADAESRTGGYIGGPIRIQPIREVPGAVEYKETVLA